MLEKPIIFKSLESVQLPANPLHLAIGMFDGVHLGHQAVLKSVIDAAKKSNGIAAVLTFTPHPAQILHPESAPKLIMSDTAKSSFIQQLGIDCVIEHPFTLKFSKIEAKNFLPYLKQHLPMLVHIYIGENFRFGKKRKGDVALLKQQAPKLDCQITATKRIEGKGEPISSSRIRKLIETGNMAIASELLGYRHTQL